MADPLVVTLALDEASFARFDGLRRRHFPPERNLVPAHVTLFHHLPGTEIDAVAATLAEAAEAEPPLALEATGLRFLGRGVAYDLRSPDLAALRGRLADRWRAWLTPQDAQRFRPHVTVQNKVAPERARALLEALQAEFAPFRIEGRGLLLWHYRGGPWEPAARFPFAAAG